MFKEDLEISKGANLFENESNHHLLHKKGLTKC